MQTKTNKNILRCSAAIPLLAILFVFAYPSHTALSQSATTSFGVETFSSEPTSPGFFDSITNIFGGGIDFVKDLFGFGGPSAPEPVQTQTVPWNNPDAIPWNNPDAQPIQGAVQDATSISAGLPTSGVSQTGTNPNDPYDLYGGIFEDTGGVSEISQTQQIANASDPYDLYGGIFDSASDVTSESSRVISALPEEASDYGLYAGVFDDGTGSILTGSSGETSALSNEMSSAVGDIFGDLGFDNVLGEGFGDTLSDGLGGALPGGVGDAIGGITGLFGGGGGGSYVPTKDFVQISLQQKQVTKEYGLDPVASLVSKTTLRGILANVLNFVNSGDNGNPYYVTNSTGHFQNVERGVTQKFLVEMQGLGVNRNIVRSLALSESTNYRNGIRPTVNQNELGGFLNRSDSGWGTWLKMFESQNNPYGQYVLSSQELQRRQREAELRESQELAWGRGYKSAKVCLIKDPVGNCLYSEVVTPGSFIENQQAAVFSSIIRQLESDDELQEVTSILLSGMISQILGGRPTGLRSFSGQAILPIASPVADAAAIDRTRSGLHETLTGLFADESEYLSKKSGSLVRLDQVKKSLETLLPERVYSFTGTLQSRVTGSAELAAAVQDNKNYATTTVNQVIIPAQKLLAGDIVFSKRLLEEIRALGAKLSNARTPNDLMRISNEYVSLSKQTHGKAALEKVNEESKILDDFAIATAGEVSSRFGKESAIIEKIKAELSTFVF